MEAKPIKLILEDGTEFDRKIIRIRRKHRRRGGI